jgi:hypothetical protein
MNVPYPGIWRQLNAGQVVPFLGAGASLVGRSGPKPWTGLSSNCLPTAGELADFLATESVFPSEEQYDRSDLAKVSSYYAEIMGRTRLRQLLREVLSRDLQPGPLHRLLARTGRKPDHRLDELRHVDRTGFPGGRQAIRPGRLSYRQAGAG